MSPINQKVKNSSSKDLHLDVGSTNQQPLGTMEKREAAGQNSLPLRPQNGMEKRQREIWRRATNAH
jgi:hypothetical protein